MKKEVFMLTLFLMLIMGYSFLITYKANLQVIDDHIILNNLMVGKFFYEYWSSHLTEIGRFYPLNMQEFNLINFFIVNILQFQPDVKYFYFFLSIEFLIVIYLSLKIGTTLSLRKKLLIIFLFILIFSPGFVTSFFRLHIGERNVLFFLLLFLFLYLKYQQEQKFRYLLYCLISANMTLYYKEPVFLMLGSFAFLHLVFGWKEINSKQRICDYALIVSSVIFVAIYFFVVFLHKGNNLYGDTNINFLLQLLKNFFNYTLSDPVIIFLLLPIVLWRLYCIIKTKSFDALYDSLLFSSLIYFMVFLKLNLTTSYHYLLPVYSFGIFAILHFVFNLQLYKKLFFKFLLLATFLFVIASSLPTGLHLISHYKNVPNNFQNTLTFLTEYIKNQSKNGKKVSIFLDGVNRNTGVEVYGSFIKYLEFRGLDPSLFDFKSDEDDNGILKLKPADPNSKYTVWRQTTASHINKGDLLIITPYTTKYIGPSKKEIEVKLSEYELLYHTDSFIEIPNFGIKAIIKGLFMKSSINQHEYKMMVSRNIFGLPLDFYVLRKR